MFFFFMKFPGDDAEESAAEDGTRKKYINRKRKITVDLIQLL